MTQNIDMDKFFKPKKFSFKKYIPHFIRNVWYFRKELNEFRSWDWMFNIMMFRRSLELLENTLQDGFEIERTRLPKLETIRETISVLRQIEEGSHFERAMISFNLTDDQLPSISNFMYQKLMERSIEIEQRDWDRLIELLRDNDKGILTWWD